MNRITFGRTGLQVSRLGFGGAPIGLLHTDRERVGTMLNALLDAGVNLVDTAAGYEGSEELIGETVGHRRGEFVLVSKCGREMPGLPGPEFSQANVTATVEQSLRRLQTDRLDVMLLHSCDLETLRRGEAIGALVKAREQGKIRFAGYSGDNDAAAYAVTLPDVAVVETSVSIADQSNIDTVLPGARQHDVGVLAKRPIANAAWKDISDQQGFYQTYAKVYTDRLRQMNITPADLGFPGNPIDAWPALALHFTLSIPGVHCAIIGTTNPDNAKRNIELAGQGPLPAPPVAKLREAFRTAAAGKDWHGQI
jgi:aryl-alcohol dehydrogenase-like predicted oxidoreductase